MVFLVGEETFGVSVTAGTGSAQTAGLEARYSGGVSSSPHHLEFGNVEQAIATEANRGVLGKIVWTF